ncbi:MAG: alpha-amylase [Anaerolineae bacterium]|nr:alpha-amylase [Anaerolineae bacterium]
MAQEDKMSVPGWVQDSIFYQIFPDRFANGHNGNNPKSVLPWNAKPTLVGFHGGDIKGIIDHMYYLLDLGINAIYLNPIFLSPSNHRYNAVDYFQIDPKLGNKVEFFTLLDVAHRNEMKVILDGVFNHCGRGFFAFNDVLENQSDSPYTDWFHIKKFPVDAYSPGDATTFDGWWKYKSLPKFNTSNPEVEKYILKVARYWIEQGIDGWRLDVPNEINDDGFWLRFRNVVRSANPDAYLVGEIWDGDPRWVSDNHFDGLMNYPLRDLIVDMLAGELKMEQFKFDLQKIQTKYSKENTKAMYNLLGSHDVERFLTKVGGDIAKAKLGYLLLFTMSGVPAIYYGDEIGLLGGKDPDCRRTFNWDESQWMTPLRDWIKKLIRFRKDKVALRRGNFQLLNTEPGNNCLAFIRVIDHECGLILINFENSPSDMTIDLEGTPLATHKSLRNVLATEEFVVIDKKITVQLPAVSGSLFFTY